MERVANEAVAAFESESKIVDWMVNGINREGLSAEILKEFIKDRINSSLEQIGYKPIFEIDQTILEKTLWFQEDLLANNMADFFHSKDTGYSKKNKSYSEDDLF